jgi:hypothetical protein
VGALLLLVIALAYFVDEPLRRKMEADLNKRLKGYSVRIARLDFHPIGFSLDLEDATISQIAHPDPPVAHIPNLTASVEWRALLFGSLVADFQIDQPKIYINRKQLTQEVQDEVPVKEKGWQEALEAIYPLKIDHFEINDADLTYVDDGPFKPLHLRNINFRAENIRNVRVPEQPYPSTVHLEAAVFDRGKLVLDGNANFLAEPHVAVKAAINLDEIQLDYFKPIIQRQNFTISGGTFSGAGQIEYAEKIKIIDIPKITVRGVKAEYLNKTEESVTKKVAKKVDKETKELADEPTLQFKMDQLQVTDSEIGFVNQTARPQYRMFMDRVALQIKNVTNQSKEQPAVGTMTGKFMGSGDAQVRVAFRPNAEGPDMDLNVVIENTDMRTMNDLFRAYGNFDVVRGIFSLYTEMAVRNGLVKGSVKPFFKDMDVYDQRQDREKSLFRKLYEGVIGGMSWLLQNKPREQVATTTTISGKLSNPQTSTFEVIVGLIQNAFFKAILPGFEKEVSSRGGKPRLSRDEPAATSPPEEPTSK